MTDLIITCGHETHSIPLTASPNWIAAWSPSESGPDVRSFQREDDGVYLFEIEISLASFRRGQKAKATVPAEVKITAQRGYTIAFDCKRPWPSIWFPMHAACRRIALYPTGDADRSFRAQTLAAMPIDKALWRKNRQTFGPTMLPLPNLPAATKNFIAAQFASWLPAVRAALMNGTTAYVESTEDGPVSLPVAGFRVNGIKDRGAPAGEGIFFDTGYQADATPDAAPLFWLQACCAHERFWHAYDRDTGRILTADDYPDGAIKYQAGTGDPNNGWLPEFVGIATNPDPLFLPFDSAHASRGFRHAVALSEMTDSPMVKHMIASQAAQFRLQLGDRTAYPSNSYWPPSIRNLLIAAQQSPNTGGTIWAGRLTGWPMFIWGQDIKVNLSPGSMAAARMSTQWSKTCAPDHGITQRVMHAVPQQGQQDIWYDPTWDLAHSFEAPIYWTGNTGCARQLHQRDPQPMLAAAKSLLSDVKKGTYYSGDIGPMDYLYVAARGGAPVNPLTDGKAGASNVIGDPTHQEHLAALAFSHDSDHKWLEWSCGVGQPAPSLAQKRANIEARTNLYGLTHLLAFLQRTS